MALIKSILIIITALIICSCLKNNLYSLKIEYNRSTHYSSVILSKNNVNIDSIRIMDYYGVSKIKKLNNKMWHISHIMRCGTDCSRKTQYIFLIKNEKIINALNLPLSYEDPELKDSLYITNIDKDSLNMVHYTFYNKIGGLNIYNQSVEYSLKYDTVSNIFYNYLFTFKGLNYKAIKFDDGIHPFINNTWGYYIKDSLYIVNEY